MPEATMPSPKEKNDSLPPGMVIGPDGKPCKICTAFRHWKVPNDSAQSKARTQQSSNAVMAAITAGSNQSQPSSTPDTRPDYCPPDVEQLGRATWTFLHTTAAYYPEKPTPNQRANMLSLIRALPVLYPCSYCAWHFGEALKEHPPDVSGRVSLSRWLCERHNDVNERLGKLKFNCAIQKLDERWKDGPPDGSCD